MYLPENVYFKLSICYNALTRLANGNNLKDGHIGSPLHSNIMITDCN